MSDYNSSLPIRTESDGDAVLKVCDATVTTQQLKVNADGSIDANVVNADVDIRSLDANQDNVAISDGTNTASVTGSGQLNVKDDDLTFANDKVDVTGSSVTVSATDLDIRDIDAATDSITAHLFDEAGAAYSLTNPLPVEVVSDASGDEVASYNTSAAVAKDASVNHDYTVTAAKTLLIDSFWVSASGKIKVEVLVNAVSKFVAFNSTANSNISIPVNKIAKCAATQVVRITITNLDNGAQDVYSTLLGLEV